MVALLYENELERVMFTNPRFKKSALYLSMKDFIQWNHNNKKLCLSVFLSLCTQHVLAVEEQKLDPASAIDSQVQSNTHLENPLDDSHAVELDPLLGNPNGIDTVAMLEQQERLPQQIEDFKNIELEELDDLNVADLAVDQNMANEIYKVAEQAKNEAEIGRNSQTQELVVQDATQQELLEINHAPVNVEDLRKTIQADSKIDVQPLTTSSNFPGGTSNNNEPSKEPNFFKRLYYKVRPPRLLNASMTKISADVSIVEVNYPEGISKKEYDAALTDLKTNIQAKLSSFTQESFADFQSSLPQLRTLSSQAAQAVGFYDATFKFEQLSDKKVGVQVTPNKPVLIASQDINFTGAGETQAQFQVINVMPDLEPGQILHHGKYENTKNRINEAANNNGYFDSYWRLHDVKIDEPLNENEFSKAAINLKFETGERYKLGNVEFRMSDPSKPFPLDKDVLEKLIPWQNEVDYTFWRVNLLANNLTNSRYFNYTLVDAVKPEPIEKELELPPDIQALVDENQIQDPSLQAAQKKQVSEASDEALKTVVDETQFIGADRQVEMDDRAKTLNAQLSEKEKMAEQARIDKKIPVLVTLNADRLNSAEVGLGYGTDTGVRMRGQYRRAIVNSRGHSFDANLELSQIRQAVDARYNIPYKHPLNDYLSIVGGYEREERENVAQGENMQIESAVAGIDRIIKNPRGSWQHTYGLRYRLDRLSNNDFADLNDIPEEFLVNTDSEQQSLLIGYEISKTDSNRRINPSKGFKQIYKIELGSENLLSDADMALVNAGWRFIYSLGENENHQFVGRADLGYIFTEDFNKVPYNIRYFTGGDQTIRGFDYKSLAANQDGYKIGGQALGVGSIEYNYQFKEGWRAAVFSDFGNAYDKDFNTPTAYSAGVGIRWASPIGPIRIDVASGLSDDNHPVRLHFAIGSTL